MLCDRLERWWYQWLASGNAPSRKSKKTCGNRPNLWPDTTAVDPFVYNHTMHYNDSLSKVAPVTAQVKSDRKLAHLLSFEPHITTEQLSKIQCPALVIGGDHDVLLPKHTLLIAESIPESYLWIVPNSGHSTLIRYKNEFNQVVDDFFKHPYRKIKGVDRFN